MNDPDNLKYTPEHHWVRQEPDGTVTTGITFHAQEALGDIVYVEGPQPGRQLARGEVCGVIESVKTAADLHAPVAGVVIAVNEAAAGKPESINADPYGTWLFRLRAADTAELDTLLDVEAYLKLSQTASS